MISYQDALTIVLETTLKFKVKGIPLSDSEGHVLAEPIVADRDFPPFDRVCMDGISIDYSAYKEGHRNFKVASLQAAGDPQSTLTDRLSCIEVMTGSVLPKGTTTVIPYEDTENTDSYFTVPNGISDRKNIHYKGSDSVKNATLQNGNCIISAAEIAVLATVGCSTVKVVEPPSVAIISTGDELIDVDTDPEPHQIRKSNSYALQALLKKYRVKSNLFHLDDNYDELKKTIADLIKNYDVLMLSGGVSKGKKDFLPQVFEELGTEQLFHRVSQRPGKPFWFGRNGTTIIFAFPGNPVSTLSCAAVYFIPWLRKNLGITPHEEYKVRLSENVTFKPDLTYFAPAKISPGSDTLYAKVIKGNGSGDLANLLHVDGFVVLPQGSDIYMKDQLFNFIYFR
ncbi:MAG: molybdopterin molybdotransferase MoeA [Chitinophagales bacterium]|nr:molybdopterin molybdotransferase MoeA [Chitinophagales bacterium]